MSESQRQCSSHSKGRWTTWEDVVQRSISWNEIWKMSPYRLAFVIRSIYDQLPSRDNLRRWGLTEDCKCELCGESETLHHVLSNCKYALDNGRYTWRHNKVLKEVVEATKMAVARANSRKIILQRKVYFLREGFSLPLQETQTPFEERHSRRGQRLDRRSRPRRIEALSPIA